jgi:hypothetical protein
MHIMSRYKYPRTPHLPWSPGASSDDIWLDAPHPFVGREVVVTEKLDGENTTMYTDHIHARSIDSKHHPSRDWVKQFHANIAYHIPKSWRVCGENMFAKHSIGYDSLESYFYMFSIWNEHNVSLSWDETLEWAALLGCVTPRELYRGTWDEALFRSWDIDTNVCEGYVVRLASCFAFSAFADSVAKWVRTNHVQTDQHWMHQAITPNQLRPVNE